MSTPASLLRFATSAFVNQTLMPASACLSLQVPETEENTVGTKVVGRFRTRWFSPGENFCVSPPLTSGDEEYPEFPASVLPPISVELVQETEEEKNAPKIEVVRRWRTESIPANQPFCLTPVPTESVPPNEFWGTCYDAAGHDLSLVRTLVRLMDRDAANRQRDAVAAPPPSLKPIPDEAFYNGPPQAAEPGLIPVYHRWRTEWIRPGDNFALTPGFNLEQFNAHVCEPKPEIVASWSQASAWALAQKSSETSKE
jgi:hypothetical protein